MTTISKKRTLTVDAIVPCYNEAQRVSNVLEVLSKSKHIKKIIFVDDGSTDNSSGKAKKFPNVQIVRLEKNNGKGQAVKAGLKHVTSNAIFLCDADLSGLTEKTIKIMVKTYQKYPKAMIVGVTQKTKSKTIHWLRKNIAPLMSGQRVISKSDLKAILNYPLSYEYGLEAYMNYYYKKKHKPIVRLLLEGVKDVPNFRKASHGLKPWVHQHIIFAKKYTLIYTKELPHDTYNNIKSSISKTKNKIMKY